MRPLRILVVDDHRDCADMLAMMLITWGHEAVAAHSATEAVERAAGLVPDAVLLNLAIEPAGGYALADALRRLPGCAGAAFVAVTGYCQPNDFAASAEHGFLAHVVKGQEVDELDDVLRSVAATA